MLLFVSLLRPFMLYQLARTNLTIPSVGSLNMIIVRSSIADTSLLGAMFGLQQTFAATARAIAPTFVSSLFAFSINHQVLGGYGVWVVMALLSLLGLFMSYRTSQVQLPGMKRVRRT
jgi:hypothetical protein